MKVENVSHSNLRIITFDDNDTQMVKDECIPYHIFKNIYNIPARTLNNITSTKPLRIFIKQHPANCDLCWQNDENNESIAYTIVDNKKFSHLHSHYYDHEILINSIIEAEIEPKLPLYFYPIDSKQYIKRYVEKKLPDNFIYKNIFLEIIENPNQSYDFKVLIPMYKDLFPYKKINVGISQSEFNTVIRENINALSNLFLL